MQKKVFPETMAWKKFSRFYGTLNFWKTFLLVCVEKLNICKKNCVILLLKFVILLKISYIFFILNKKLTLIILIFHK